MITSPEPTRLILGTAGHIDHGKTALVRALTGIDTDRLPEEKRRGITIDLGFAQLDLGDYQLGIVDVPGHERFIRNMLAGSTGFDIALLIVAADDSIMPQTREHLAILQLLDIPQAVIALTKVDLVDEAWLELVEEEVRQLVAGTFAAGAPIVRTSATTGQGLDELREALARAAASVKRRDDPGLFRLAVDRSFTMPGVGTVVTGTVWSGSASVGDEVEWLPPRRLVRIRGIESHGRSVGRITRGQRAAINLASVHHTQIMRGHELATAGYLSPSRVMTVEVRVLPDSPWPLRHRSRLRLHLGTQEILVRLSLLSGTAVQPGETAAAQLTCAQPAIAAAGQPFVLRAETPLVTIGGGHVLQPAAKRISRRHPERIDQLRPLREGDERGRAMAAIGQFDTVRWSALDLCRDAALSRERAESLLADLQSEGVVVTLDQPGRGGVRVHRDVLANMQRQVRREVKKMHEASPLDPAVTRLGLRQRLNWLDADLVDAVIDRMINAGELRGDEQRIALADFAPALSDAQQRLLAALIAAFEQGRFAPPEPAEFAAQHAAPESQVRSLLDLAVAQSRLVHLGGVMYLHRSHHRGLIQLLLDRFSGESGFAIGELRDALNTSRKFALRIGDWLDHRGITRRVGEKRIMTPAAKAALDAELAAVTDR